MTTPSRDYSWAPFPPGHELTLRHGGYSPRRIDPLATQLVELVLGMAATAGSTLAYLASPAFAPALWAWGRAEARVQLLDEDVQTNGHFDQTGNPRATVDALAKWETIASNHRQRLGLDPTSYARLRRDQAAAADMALHAQAAQERLRARVAADVAEEEAAPTNGEVLSRSEAVAGMEDD